MRRPRIRNMLSKRIMMSNVSRKYQKINIRNPAPNLTELMKCGSFIFLVSFEGMKKGTELTKAP